MIRLVNRVITFVVGAALLAGGLLVVVEALWTWTNSGFVWIPGHQWLTSFETTAWSAPIVIAVSTGVTIIGLLLLVAQVRPQPKRVVPYQTSAGVDWVLLRRSTEAHLSRRLATQVPVSPIKTRLKPKVHKWVLTVTARAAQSTRPVLEEAAQSELAVLHAPSPSQVKVKTSGATKAAS